MKTVTTAVMATLLAIVMGGCAGHNSMKSMDSDMDKMNSSMGQEMKAPDMAQTRAAAMGRSVQELEEEELSRVMIINEISTQGS